MDEFDRILRLDYFQDGGDPTRLRARLLALTDALDRTAIVAETDAKGKISYANDRFVEISGYSRAELIGQDHRLVNSGFHPKSFMKDLWATIASGRVWRGEIRNRAKDGRIYWVDTAIAPILDQHGRPARFIAIRFDITSRKAAEAELTKYHGQLEDMVRERTRQLESTHERLRLSERLAAVGTLVDSIAHEVNNPIGIISLKARNVLFKFRDRIPEKVGSEMNKIVEQCDRLNRLTRDLLDFSRPSRGEKAPLDVLLPLKTATAAAFHAASPGSPDAAPGHGPPIELVEDYGPDLPPVLANRSELEQVFVNIIANAIQAMPSGGVLRLAARHEPKGLPGGRPSVTVEVRDTGQGMPEHVRDRIFEPFFTTKEAGLGTGLGLAICFGLMQSHRGQIDVESAPGQGSGFFLRFPVAEAAPKPAPQAAPAQPAPALRAKVRLLVVDDEPEMLEGVADVLARIDGAEVVQEGDSGRAADRLREERFDVLVTDMRMPGMDGLALLDHALKQDPGLQVLVLTGFASVQAATEAMKLGASDYMGKPFVPEDLLARVAALVEKGKLRHRPV